MFPDFVQETIEIGGVGRCWYRCYVTDEVFPVYRRWMVIDKGAALCVGFNKNKTIVEDCVCMCIYRQENNHNRADVAKEMTPFETLVIAHLLSSVSASYPESILCGKKIIDYTPTYTHYFDNAIWCCGKRQGKVCLCLNKNNDKTKDIIEMSQEMSLQLVHALTKVSMSFYEEIEFTKEEYVLKGRLELMKMKVWDD